MYSATRSGMERRWRFRHCGVPSRFLEDKKTAKLISHETRSTHATNGYEEHRENGDFFFLAYCIARRLGIWSA